jgi:hypothetical protein
MKSFSIFAIPAALLFLVALGGRGAYAQQEIDPEHFDSPSSETITQPRTADSRVRVIRYRGTFSLPYSVLCSGKKLGPGKYSIWVRSDGKVGQATLNQKGHAIEIAGVVHTEAAQQRAEVVVVENYKHGRTLSLVRARGFALLFDPEHPADRSRNGVPTSAEKLPLSVIAPDEIGNRAPSGASAKPQ